LARSKEQEQEAVRKKHPYQHLENDAAWRVLEKGIRALVKNGDVEEKTARTHIVGYLTQLLHDAGVGGSNGSAKHRRIVQIHRDEEVVVRGVVAER
jgi:hypothetical protein